MASDVSFVEFVCDQLRDVGEPSFRKMFGEYAIYLDGRVVALVCDDRLFVKQTAGGRALMEDPVELPPYPGAKPHFLIEDRLDADYRRFNTSKSRRFNLCYAEGFEAMTCAWGLASIAEAEAGRSTLSPGPWGQLWAWHLAEEMEHRTVAFDLYEHLEGSYPYRVIGSLRAQLHFQRTIHRLQRILLASQGAPAKRHLPPWWTTGRSRYLATFTPGYDPGEIDPGPLPGMILSQYAA